VNEALLEVFRHNAWATRRLIAFCRALPESALSSTTAGTYGGILATFDHLVSSDGGYLHSLSGTALDWAINRVEAPDLDVLEARAEQGAALWETFLAEPVDAGRVLLLDNGTYEVNAGIVVAQALHHGNAHREQICAILTSLGMEPPDIQPWGFADETGRSRWI
jgi:uncharacterized damage-inducible protein DinB